ncbi:MAG TPA: GAF domain-containing sensor histidine kinase [Jiangellaceae bacterium]|nr:GAF domain-containing sensor histidine kinase [Jiangellaceae bacterium]
MPTEPEPSSILPPLSRVGLDDLLGELMTRTEQIQASRDRIRALLDAVVAVGSGLDLRGTLSRIVVVACELVNAKYGALGVLRRDGTALSEFVTHGLTDEERATIGPIPHGHGILGLLIREPRPVRLRDITSDPRAYGFPEHHPLMHTFLGVPLRIRNEVFGNLYLTEKAGGAEFTDEDEQVVMALASAAGVAIENARLYQRGQQRQQWLEGGAEIVEAILGDAERDASLELVARRARELAGADLAAILVVQADELVLAAASSSYSALAPSARLPIEGTLLGQVTRSGKPMVADDAVDGPNALTEIERESLRLGPAVAASLGSSEGAVGVLVVGVAAGTDVRYLEEDVQLLGTFAAQASLALERAHAQAVKAQLAVFEDRDRIARDLHDLVIQRLYAAGLRLQGTLRLIDDAQASSRVQAAIDDLDTTIREIRSTIFELHQRGGEKALTAELRAVLQEAETSFGLAPQWTVVGPVERAVPESVRPHLVATLREALANAGRHSGASQVNVRLEVGRTVTLEVIDNGVGIPPGVTESGLRNLRERAESLGGELEALPGQPTGTTLRWWVPAEQ